jgi:hypothetical protein
MDIGTLPLPLQLTSECVKHAEVTIERYTSADIPNKIDSRTGTDTPMRKMLTQENRNCHGRNFTVLKITKGIYKTDVLWKIRA